MFNVDVNITSNRPTWGLEYGCKILLLLLLLLLLEQYIILYYITVYKQQLCTVHSDDRMSSDLLLIGHSVTLTPLTAAMPSNVKMKHQCFYT